MDRLDRSILIALSRKCSHRKHRSAAKIGLSPSARLRRVAQLEKSGLSMVIMQVLIRQNWTRCPSFGYYSPRSVQRDDG